MACHIGVAARHIDAGHARRDAVDAVAGASQATDHGVAGAVDDPGAAVVQVKAQAAGAGQAADHHGVGMTVYRGNAADAARGAAPEDQVEVAGVDAADILAEGHGIADRTAVARVGVDTHYVAGAWRGGVHHDARGAAQAIEGQVQIVARQVGQLLAAQVDAVDRDAVAVVVAGLHDVLEHQRGTATAGDVGAVTGHPAHIQHQARRQCADLQRFAAIDGEGQHVAGLVVAVQRRGDADHRWRHAVDVDVGGAGHGVEGHHGVIAGNVADAAAIELHRAAQGHAIAVQLAAGNGQAEHQGAAAGARNILRKHGAAGVQGHGDARHATRAVDDHVFTEVDREVQILANDVGAIGRCADARHHRHYAVDHDIAAPAQRVGAAHGRQGQDRKVTGVVADHRAVHLQRGGALEVQVGADIAGLHDVLEHQGVRSRAADIHRVAVHQAGLQQQGRRATAQIDVDHLVPGHADQHIVADLHGAVQALRSDADHLRVHRNHIDRDGVDIGLRPTAAGIAVVVGLDGQAGGAEEGAAGLEAQGLQRSIDIGAVALEDHARVVNAGAQQQGDAAQAAQAQGAVGRRQDHGHQAIAGVHIVDGDGVAIGGVEAQGNVLRGGLRARHVVDRRVVHRSDDEGDGLGVGLLAAAAAEALVVQGHRQHHVGGGILGSLEGQAVGRDKEVDIGQAAGQGQRAGTRAAHGDAQAGGRAQGTARYREGCGDVVDAGIDVGEAEAADHARHILGHGDGRRRSDHRRIVHRSDLQGHRGGGIGHAGGVDVDGQGHITAGVGRRGVEQAVVGDEQVDIGQGAAQGQGRRRAAHGHAAGADGAEGAAADRESRDTEGGVDIAEGDLAKRCLRVFGDRQRRYGIDGRRIVDRDDGDVTGHGRRLGTAAIGDDELHGAGGAVRAVRGVVIGNRPQRGLELGRSRRVPGGSQGQGAITHGPGADDIAHGQPVVDEAQRVLGAVVGQHARGGTERVRAIRVGQGQARVHSDRGGGNVVAFAPGRRTTAHGHLRSIVDGSDHHAGSVGVRGIGRGAAGNGGIALGTFKACGTAGLVPSLVDEGRGFAVDAIRDIADLVGPAQDQRRGIRDRADIGPAGAVIEAELPFAIGAGQSGDGDAFHRAGVDIGDAPDQRADQVARVVGGRVVQPGQGRQYAGHDWRVVDRSYRLVGHRRDGGERRGATVAAGIGSAADTVDGRAAGALVPGTEGQAGRLAVGTIGDVADIGGGRQQQRAGAGHGTKVGPVGVVGGVLPGTVAGLGDHRDAAQDTAIGVDHGVVGQQGRDLRAAAGGVLVDARQAVRPAGQDRCIVDADHGHGAGDPHRDCGDATVVRATVVAQGVQGYHPVGGVRAFAVVAIGHGVEDSLRRRHVQAGAAAEGDAGGAAGHRDRNRDAVVVGGQAGAVDQGHIAAIDHQLLGRAVGQAADGEGHLDHFLPGLDGVDRRAAEQLHRRGVLGVGRVAGGNVDHRCIVDRMNLDADRGSRTGATGTVVHADRHGARRGRRLGGVGVAVRQVVHQGGDRGRVGVAGEADHQRVAIAAAGVGTDHQAVVQDRGAGQDDLVGAGDLIANEQHVLAGRTARRDLHGQLATAEIGGVSVDDGGVATVIEEHVGRAFGVGNGVAIEVADHRCGHRGDGEIQRRVVLDALVDLAVGVDEGLVVDAHGVAHAGDHVGRRVDGPGRAATGDGATADGDGLNDRVIAGAHNIDIARALGHRLVKGQGDIGIRGDGQAVVGRRGTDQLGQAAALHEHAGLARGGRGRHEIDIAITVEIADAVLLVGHVRQDHAGEWRRALGDIDERAVVVAYVFPRAIAESLIEDVGIAVAIEVRHHHPVHRGCRQVGRTGQVDEGPVVIAQVAHGLVGGGDEDIGVAIAIHIRRLVQVGAEIGQGHVAERRTGVGAEHRGE